jgi:hypothetical protein
LAIGTRACTAVKSTPGILSFSSVGRASLVPAGRSGSRSGAGRHTY